MTFEKPTTPWLTGYLEGDELARALFGNDAQFKQEHEAKDAKFLMFHKTGIGDKVDEGWISANELISERVAIVGMSGSGKTTTGMRFCEEAINNNIPVLIIDITAEYGAISEVFGSNKLKVINEHSSIKPEQIAESIIKDGVSFVLQPSETEDIEIFYKKLPDILECVWQKGVEGGFPIFVVVEECHNFIPRDSTRTTVPGEFYKPIMKKLLRISKQGRRAGQSLVLLTQRVTEMETTSLTQSSIIFFHRVIHNRDLDLYAEIIPGVKWEIREYVSRMKNGEVIYYKNAAIRIGKKVRMHRAKHFGKSKQYSDVEAAMKEAKKRRGGG